MHLSSVKTLSDNEYEFPLATDSEVGFVSIELNHTVLGENNFDNSDEYHTYVLKEGSELAVLLAANLPESVLDAMMVTLMDLRASEVRTRLRFPVKGSVD